MPHLPFREVLKLIGIALSAILVAGFMVGVGIYLSERVGTDLAQDRIAPFYVPPSLAGTSPGDLLNFEQLEVPIAGGTAYRILYVTTTTDDELAASSGTAFIPAVSAAEGGRPTMAWAHGTVGQGDECAPSRSADPTSQLATFLPQMLDLGWAVVATDYYGLGTPGVERYLIGEQEARDVVNSVRAVAQLPGADTSKSWGVYGHSQGGHSAIWTGQLANELAPELSLVGVAAAAPAAELTRILDAQWSGLIGWVIGAEVLHSWPLEYPELPVDSILTSEAQNSYMGLAEDCVQNAALEATVRQNIYGQNFFEKNPLSVPEWLAAMEAQTPAPLPADLPFFLAQGTADEVVLPEPNAYLEQKWCAAGSTLTSLWMGGVGHVSAGLDAGPSVVRWMWERFEGLPALSTCDFPPPVATEVPSGAAS